MSVRVGLWGKLSAEELMLLNCGVGEDSWESLGLWGPNQSILKEISPGISLEGLRLKLKLPYFGHLMRRADSLEKTLMLGRTGVRRRRGRQPTRWLGHHWLEGHEFEWTPGVGDGQGGLACCNSWGHKESDMTEWLNWTEVNLETRSSKLNRNLKKMSGAYAIFKHLSTEKDVKNFTPSSHLLITIIRNMGKRVVKESWVAHALK